MSTRNTTTKAAKRCCGTSVGVIITDQADRMLMVTRGWWPKGTAPVAGHVRDAHESVAEALVAEVQEEVGLAVVGSSLVWEGHLPNLCASLPHQPLAGHYWHLGVAEAEGEVVAAPGETKGARFYGRDEVDALAEVTLAHYRSGGQAADQPDESIEAVWLRLLHEAGRLPGLTAGDLAVAEAAYTTAPGAYWLGGRS
ncbi:ADP-ribose pyrophosphatase YjhB (NUDIX family) [Nocardiopsis sp. Huas11]|uniref:NUDIX hydrolase n=1 Tax=Nocardiopsis sp. Huas11 TaxID=2183912 RepID=UPI000EB08A7E|nr:NUDIX domain-containing protein [Nocardiopsis sp. Huas11]RKR98972.1 ADP-ribose pyrophosphatase YjhB (NUDIX family) [Nocardiopsis sp. Huas11]